jgi:hypothetical protein
MTAYEIEHRLYLCDLWREAGHDALADAAEPTTADYGQPGDRQMRHDRNVAWAWIRDRARARDEPIADPILHSAP